MFSRSVMRAVLRWCSARSNSSNVLAISATASVFLSFSWREISVTSSMAAVSWGSLQDEKIYTSMFWHGRYSTNIGDLWKQMPNLGQTLLSFRTPDVKAIFWKLYQSITCCVWHPAVSSAQPCAALRHPAEERSHVPGARPLCSPDTWLSHTTRSRTPSPAEGDKLSWQKSSLTLAGS